MFLNHYSFLTNRRIFSYHICWMALLLVVLSGYSKPAATQVTEASKPVDTQLNSDALSPDAVETIDVSSVSQQNIPAETSPASEADLILISLIKQTAKPLLAPFSESAAKESQTNWAASLKQDVVITNSTGMQLTLIPPGEFMMGSPATEPEHQNHELQHRVKITKPFYLGTYEVTQAEYQKIMGENPSWFSQNGRSKDKVAGKNTDRFPVEFTNWHESQIFCRKLSEREGKSYRLPTEAEWEYACRAGTTTPFHYGRIDNGRLSNTYGGDPYGTSQKGPVLGRTTQVGSYKPNAFGLYDMHGNVFEWCADWFVPPVYQQRAGKLTVDPLVSTQSPDFKTRVLRGGSWNKGKDIHARSALRRGNLPDWKGQNIGFRVVQEIAPETQLAQNVPAPSQNKKLVDSIKDPRAGELVFIPPGKFLMGSLESEPGSWPDERPQHPVEIKEGFFIGKYEVTFEEFISFSAETHYKTDAKKSQQGGGGYLVDQKDIVNQNPLFSWRFPGFPQKSKLPVTNISWNDAVAYCNWLTEKDGKYRFRLPTEAEWEYCARAGTTAAFAWGEKQESLISNENTSDQSLARLLNPKSFHKNRCGKWDDGFPFTAPVGTFKPNPFGLYDMLGNVSEWCADVYLKDRYRIPDDRVPATGAQRVLKGGNFDYLPMDCRVARRIGAQADKPRCDRGFRVVREAKPLPEKPALAKNSEPPAPQKEPDRRLQKPVVAFTPVPTEKPVTSFTISEDNKYLICSHQGDDQVSIWDTVTRKLVKTLTTPSPRSLLSRGDLLLVANDGKGTISLFSAEKQWALTNQLDVDKPHIVYLSAPQGKYFHNEILVTCHGEGVKASYSDCQVYHLNLETDRDTLLSKAALATCSYNGKYVITQGSFNLSPSGGITVFDWDDFITEESPYPIYKGGIQQTPYAYQVHPGSYWLGNNLVFGGIPLGVVQKDMGNLVIGDRTRKLLYAINPTELKVYPVNAVMEEATDRKAEFPKGEFSHLYHRIYRIRGYLLDHPIAFTTQGQTHLFVLDMSKNLILAASTPAFEIPSGVNPKSLPQTPAADAANPLKIPSLLAENELFSHQLQDQQGTSYELMNQPEGLKLNQKNVLTWKPGAKQVGKHELKIKVTQGDQVAFERIEVEVVPHDLIKRYGSLEKYRNFPRFALDFEPAKLIPAADYQSFLVLQGRKVYRMTGDGSHCAETYQMAQRYEFLAEREDSFLALNQGTPQLDLLDQAGGRLKGKIPLDRSGVQVLEFTDLAVHPQMDISYVAIKMDIEVPRYRVLVINEKKTNNSVMEELLGNWVCVDSQGKRLYTGYRDLYRTGTRFHINPGWRLLQVPEYGNLDILISYKLRRGIPSINQYVLDAGGNGTGIRLSPDGKRVTYLSNGGYPSLSRNLAGWDASQFKQDPVKYETKDRGLCTQLAFHPTLDLVAVPGGKSAVLFDRETGEVIPDKLLLLDQGLGDVKIEDLIFSPDGSSLVFLCQDRFQGIYLRSVPLKLTSAEQKRATRKITVTKRNPQAAPEIPVVKQSDLEALKLDSKALKQSPREIAEHFNQSVVLIKTDTGSASGFVVGSQGYILTCAHAVSEDETIMVEFQKGKAPRQVIEATLIKWDEDQDLALLKLNRKVDLPTVILSPRTIFNTGEQLAVIGNPSAGETILSQTLTTGVISNPKRSLRGQPLIQISAAVNPGNSGGPVFDERGQVIGLVVLKADIEAAGFSIPAPELRQFLLSVTKPDVSGK